MGIFDDYKNINREEFEFEGNRWLFRWGWVLKGFLIDNESDWYFDILKGN